MRNFGIKICKRCGKEYTKTGPNQKFCHDCAKSAYKEHDKARGGKEAQSPGVRITKKG